MSVVALGAAACGSSEAGSDNNPFRAETYDEVIGTTSQAATLGDGGGPAPLPDGGGPIRPRTRAMDGLRFGRAPVQEKGEAGMRQRHRRRV